MTRIIYLKPTNDKTETKNDNNIKRSHEQVKETRIIKSLTAFPRSCSNPEVGEHESNFLEVWKNNVVTVEHTSL